MRFEFVARFAAVLLVCAVTIAAALSYVFARAHLDALKSDLITTTIGQASAAAQPYLNGYIASSRASHARAPLDRALSAIENFDPLVRAVRLYTPSGAALDPLGPPSIADVRAAIAQQNVVRSRTHTELGEQIVTVYVPLAGASGRYLAVMALDISIGQLQAQAGNETKFVVLSTIVACSVIFVSLLALAVAAQRELDKRRQAAETTFLQTMQGIATMIDQRDPYTAGHSQRVAEYAVAVACELSLSDETIERVRWSALLHDLGKIAIPDAVLLKPDSLDSQERGVIQQHPTIAKEILGHVDAMAEIVPCVLHHHERWDGRGYPAGLAGEAIPLEARVIAVADTFDAMTTHRPYRDALSVHEARRRLLDGAGAQWDTRCVNAVVALIDSGQMAPPETLNREFGRRFFTGPRPA